MKITGFDVLHADGGSRPFSFLKVSTDEGLVGWSEFTEAIGNAGTSVAIMRLGEILKGHDPCRVEAAMALAYVKTIPVVSGIAAHARAAVCNALLDISAKAQSVPVSALFGGKLRDRIPLYWSHLGGPRIQRPELLGVEPLRDYDGFASLATQAAERGFKALKMNLFSHDGTGFQAWSPGHGIGAGYPELNPSPEMIKAMERQFEAVADAGIGVMVDLNYNFKLDGYLQVCRAIERHGLVWAELDMYDANALAKLREGCRVPIASGESLYGRREFKPYFDNYAMDVAVVDVIWNGFLESYKIAAVAETYELNVAPHNFYGYLADHISAQFAAVIPNFRILEIEVDDIPWRDEFFTHTPEINNGEFIVPDRPGWGTDVIEEAVISRPWTAQI